MVSIMPFGRISTSIRCLHASDDTRALGGCHLLVVVTTRTRMEIKFEISIVMAISLLQSYYVPLSVHLSHNFS